MGQNVGGRKGEILTMIVRDVAQQRSAEKKTLQEKARSLKGFLSKKTASTPETLASRAQAYQRLVWVDESLSEVKRLLGDKYDEAPVQVKELLGDDDAYQKALTNLREDYSSCLGRVETQYSALQEQLEKDYQSEIQKIDSGFRKEQVRKVFARECKDKWNKLSTEEKQEGDFWDQLSDAQRRKITQDVFAQKNKVDVAFASEKKEAAQAHLERVNVIKKRFASKAEALKQQWIATLDAHPLMQHSFDAMLTWSRVAIGLSKQDASVVGESLSSDTVSHLQPSAEDIQTVPSDTVCFAEEYRASIKKRQGEFFSGLVEKAGQLSANLAKIPSYQFISEDGRGTLLELCKRYTQKTPLQHFWDDVRLRVSLLLGWPLPRFVSQDAAWKTLQDQLTAVNSVEQQENSKEQDKFVAHLNLAAAVHILHKVKGIRNSSDRKTFGDIHGVCKTNLEQFKNGAEDIEAQEEAQKLLARQLEEKNKALGAEQRRLKEKNRGLQEEQQRLREDETAVAIKEEPQQSDEVNESLRVAQAYKKSVEAQLSSVNERIQNLMPSLKAGLESKGYKKENPIEDLLSPEAIPATIAAFSKKPEGLKSDPQNQNVPPLATEVMQKTDADAVCKEQDQQVREILEEEPAQKARQEASRISEELLKQIEYLQKLRQLSSLLGNSVAQNPARLFPPAVEEGKATGHPDKQPTP